MFNIFVDIIFKDSLPKKRKEEKKNTRKNKHNKALILQDGEELEEELEVGQCSGMYLPVEIKANSNQIL